jgi:replicative DNA helicase
VGKQSGEIMKCFSCQNEIKPGQEMKKRVEAHSDPRDGSAVLYGSGMEGGNLEEAGGPLLWAKHSKALSLAERVLTPHGWRRAGDVAVGDVLIAGDGSACRVLAVHRDLLSHRVAVVRMKDGAECMADLEHLWMTDRGIRATRELKPGDRLPLAPAYDGWEDPAGDPYVLGALLGDGHLPLMFVTTADEQVRDMLLARCPEDSWATQRETSAGTAVWDVHVRSQEDFVLSLGLSGLTGRDKFLPASVWAWSAAARLELLRGLMDTDGHVGRKASQVGFSNSSRELALGVQELAWSLGGTGRLTEFCTTDKNKKYGPYYRVVLRTPECPFLLRRKADAWMHLGPAAGTRSMRRRKIADVIPQRATEHVVCYTIDHSSGLFVAGGFMVTHNCYWIDYKREKRQEDKRAERAADAGYSPPVEHDWRHQDVADVEELLSGRQSGSADGDRDPR